MIKFKRFRLDNGLTVILHKQKLAPIATVNLLYKVGARDEHPCKTGLAHLFEHLMFGGSLKAPDFDKELMEASAENNAFTCNDYTNYYINIPSANIETALWLEADRMRDLALNEKSLAVQKKVVIEEFKERYLNQPYGDVWLILRELVYKEHPYKWATIGKSISQIESVTLSDAKSFYDKYYSASNTILSIGGDFEIEEILEKVKYWFNDSPNIIREETKYPVEPQQRERAFIEVFRDVPSPKLYMIFKMVDRLDKDYYVWDFISDVLSNGASSIFSNILVKERKIFISVSASLSGDVDCGVFVISGIPSDNISLKEAEKAIWETLDTLRDMEISDREIQKLKNKYEMGVISSNMTLSNKMHNLAFYEFLGDASMIDDDISKYNSVTQPDVKRVLKESFIESKVSVLYYNKESNKESNMKNNG